MTIVKHKKTFVVIALFVCVKPTYSADFSLIPFSNFENKVSINTSTEYNTNPVMRAGAEKGVWQLSLTPYYKISNITDINELFADFSLNVVRSSDVNLVIDRENPTANIGWIREFERGRLNLKAHYDESSSRMTGFNESGLVFSDATRTTKSFGAGWQYLINERLTLGTNFDLNESKFDSGNSGLTGNLNKTLGGSLSYAINEKMTAVSQVLMSRFIPDGLQKPTNNLNLNTGIDWAVDDYNDFGFRVGMNKLNGQTSSSGWNGQANYGYKTERSITRLDASKSVSPSGLGNLITGKRIGASWSYNLSEKSSLGLNFSSNKNSGNNSTKSKQLGANYNYDISDLLKAGITATYRDIEDLTNTSNSKVIGFTLTYDHPVF